MTFMSSARYAVAAAALTALLAPCTAQAMVKKIRLAGKPSENAVAVLLNVGNGCRQPRVERFRGGELTVRSEMIGECWACGAEMASKPWLAVLSRGHAAVVLDGSEVCKNSELVIELEGRKTMQVAVWMPDSPEETKKQREETARDEFANADWLLDRNMAGVALDPEFNVVARTSMPEGCEAFKTRRSQTPTDLAFKDDRLNVYFVGSVNVNCSGQDALFVQEGSSLGDLAHEMGHRLGLKEQTQGIDAVYKRGHTNGAKNFDCLNTMWVASGIPDEQLTIGQAFWMGLSCDSAAGRRALGDKCLKCGSADGGPPCVPYALGATPGGCRPCTKQMSESIRRRIPALALVPDNRISTDAQMCTLGEVRAKIEARFEELSKRSASRRELPLGTTDKARFQERWTQAGIAVLAIDLADKEKDPKKKQEWITHLDKQLKSGVYANYGYLSYALERLRSNQPLDRCETGNPLYQ